MKTSEFWTLRDKRLGDRAVVAENEKLTRSSKQPTLMRSK